MSVMFDDGSLSRKEHRLEQHQMWRRTDEIPLFFTFDSQNHNDWGPDFREEIDIRCGFNGPRVRLAVESAFRALNSRINRICGINEATF